MSEHDDYLWDRSGAVDLEVARIERELGPLRWRATSIAIDAPDTPLRPEPSRSAAPREPSRWRPALIAGVAMAAAVLGLVYLARHSDSITPESNPSNPMIQPAAPPQRSPDLRDPFERRDGVRDSTAPARPSKPNASGQELLDPFGSTNEQTPTLQTQSELRNPFSGNPARKPDEPATQPNSLAGDLKDPFARARERSKPTSPTSLVDPFHGESKAPNKPNDSSGPSPDLKDPFSRRD